VSEIKALYALFSMEEGRCSDPIRKNKKLVQMIKIETRSWYVLHTRSRFENVVNEGLMKKSIDVFLPKILVRSKRKDRKKMIRVPLFPGYLFVKTDLNPSEHLEILKTAGAVRLIGNTEGPKAVPDEAVQSLMIMVRTDDPISTGQLYKKGDRVIVVYGPFAGVIGQFIRYGGKGRVVVNIEVLGQYAGVDVSEEDIEKVPEIMS
jgi:transcription termination/antitermination protein NusG